MPSIFSGNDNMKKLKLHEKRGWRSLRLQDFLSDGSIIHRRRASARLRERPTGGGGACNYDHHE
jgi:hypothetical protein